MRKIYLILILVFVASLSVATASAGLFGDDVTVKDVTLIKYNNRAKDLDTFYLDYSFSIVPNKNIDHIVSMKLVNTEMSFGNEVHKFNPTVLHYDVDKGNNIAFDQFDSLFKDDIYYFTAEFNEKVVKNRQDISHIKSDIVVNTTTENNVVIGHIDADVNLDHTKKPGGSSFISGDKSKTGLTYY